MLVFLSKLFILFIHKRTRALQKLTCKSTALYLPFGGGVTGPRSVFVASPYVSHQHHNKMYQPRGELVINPRAPTAYLDQIGDHHLRRVHALPKKLVVNLESTPQSSAVQNVRGPFSASKFHEILAVMAGRNSTT